MKLKILMFLIIMKNFNIYLQVLQLKQIKIHNLLEVINLLTIDLIENKKKDCSNFKGLSNLNKLNVNTNTSKLYWIINCENLEVLYFNNNRIKN